MKKLFVLMAALLLPFAAAAHGPAPQKVEKHITIKADPAKVWEAVKDFGREHLWHPAVASTNLEQKLDENSQPATFRLIMLKDGGTIYEKLRNIDDAGMKIKYEMVMGVLPVNDYISTMQVTAGPAAGECTVTWIGRFYRKYMMNPPIPPGEDDESAVKAISGFYDSGLPGLRKLLEGQ